ncbi:MAG: DNA topoisomerase IV [Marinilabiliales bacterium]|nr:MAG: DNA topoisomerase IV [Marinilabiliales bacterium]
MSEKYNEDSIKSLEWNEHIRLRPGMYIGKLGSGASHDDGIYVLLKEIMDNSIDEFIMGYGTKIEVMLDETSVTVRDYGRGIPMGKLVDVVSKINTGAKYDSEVFKKTVGLNGVGTKAVNALSSYFKIASYRDQKSVYAEFERGQLTFKSDEVTSNKRRGTEVLFVPDNEVFGNYTYLEEYIEDMLWNYVYLNKGLTISFNGQKFESKNGLLDLLEKNIDSSVLYPVIHVEEQDFEFAMTHIERSHGEEYYSFVNGQRTTQGGTHISAFREAIVDTIRKFYKKDFDASDVKNSLVVAISIRVHEPVFESQTKTKLGSQHMEPDGQTIRNYVGDVVRRNLDNHLHINTETAESLLKKIQQNEKERKEITNIKKLAKDSIKKASLHNKKLRDCKLHYNVGNDDRRLETTLFITEGDSASGSITKARDPYTQAVFSLKGKPLNSFGLSKRIVYENEEFNLMQSAINLEEGVENIRYNNIVIATDADVDGMHIRLLLLTFFLQFYPDLVKSGHLYILQTPLFRVRNKQKTIYCYSDQERQMAIKELGTKPEITRFKGLGEISPGEFRDLIGPEMRLEPVFLKREYSIEEILQFYMGKNTPDRQNFIIENLRVEEDITELS